tara:strand:+ start:246 stop:1010 length:765 start_codon:yes stop_codon:yes gene_type:complete
MGTEFLRACDAIAATLPGGASSGAVRQYARFLAAKCIDRDYDGTIYSPDVDNDEMWRDHMRHEKEYKWICTQLAGRTLSRDGAPTPEAHERLRRRLASLPEFEARSRGRVQWVDTQALLRQSRGAPKKGPWCIPRFRETLRSRIDLVHTRCPRELNVYKCYWEWPLEQRQRWDAAVVHFPLRSRNALTPAQQEYNELTRGIERPYTHADWRGNPQGMWIMTLLICRAYRVGVPPEMLAHGGLGEATREFVRVWA